MEYAIEAIQDRIIYLTGQIEITKNETINEPSKKAVIYTWKQQIAEMKQAQEILLNN